MLPPDPDRLRALSDESSIGRTVRRADSLYWSRRDLERALVLYDHAVRRGGDPLRVAHNQWMCAMLLGRYAAAWEICDRVLVERKRRRLSCAGAPYHERWVWDGTPLDGCGVLVRCYHGLGDAIQFLRFAKPLHRRAARVVVQAVPAVLEIARRMEGIDGVVALDHAPDPLHDVAIEASELPHALRVSAEMLAPTIPYIGLDGADRVSRGHEIDANAPTVGVAWAAGGWHPERSVPLPRFRRLFEVGGVRFVNLQRGEALAELDRAPAAKLTEWGARTTGLLATARTLLELDLVITVDTMVAHLAGALGVPVWLLLHWNADWRWLLSGTRSPWYPTIRLFRQPAPGAWCEVIDAVSAALASLRPSTNC